MDEIKEYMHWRKIPNELHLRVRRYFEYYFMSKTAFDEMGILKKLSPNLRHEVVRALLGEHFFYQPLLKKLQPLMQVDVINAMYP
eukprot:CAMPEP_0174750454 /NCGR_PEP_ID=MMETSP1094-20130205/97780_1 /TAXON_ID=156173 /ORGANISM="Chrysochromulina brevifilum, Strain UTEX LB 985" /LENGTH=84 /DNA_ID=CAMNT_0015955817 /DNA_START=1 /DNA_END=251 /DNA_ORIENTATION=+